MTTPNSEMVRVEASWNQLVELVNQVQDAGGLTRVGADGWTVKDHLAHVAAWEQSLLALIEGRDRSSGMGLTEPLEEIDAVNEAIRKLHAGDTPEEALGYFRDSHTRLTAELEKLSHADLQKPYSDYQPADPDEKRPVINWVGGNTYEHYAEHIAWINQLLSESSAAR
ncbi:MAG TPA: DinB family protein [Candidatus Dormibacteraeota bacterium]|nr:DinB family protein [Candidatus Dormibacteraeota bacterium]